MSDATWDAIVVGAGAAGLMAAIRAAERGRRVLLLEKNRKAGVKILMSGGTRCNLTQATDTRGIVDAFGEQGPFLHSPLAALDPAALVRFFNDEGVATKVESTGKIFPESDRALDVLNALRRRFDRSRATLGLEEPVVDLKTQGSGFRVTTPLRQLESRRLIVTSGGASYPGCGTTGDGYGWARQLGHRVVHPRPALVPLTLDEPWTGDLQGVTVPDVELAAPAVDVPGRQSTRRRRATRAQARGSLLFTHFGLSGPAVLNVSRCFTLTTAPLPLAVHCNFLPGWNVERLEAHLRDLAAGDGVRQVLSTLARDLPRRLAEALIGSCGIPRERRLAELSRHERRQLAQQCTQASCNVTGTVGFKKAEVTTGGIALDEVDSSTMQSKRIPGLYFAGEILDLDGPIGGYNFQAAFSTGWLAGAQV